MSILQATPPVGPATLPAQAPRGPASAAGRRASSRNAFKHGFSGKGIIMSEEMRAEFHAKLEAFAVRFRPTDAIEHELVSQAALASVRIARLTEAEEASTGERVRHAVRRWDETRAAEVRALADRLDAEPAEAVRLLKRTAEGTDYLADEWDALNQALLRDGSWDDAQAARVLCLLGMVPAPADPANPRLAEYWVDVEQARSGDEPARATLSAIAVEQIDTLTELGERLWDQFDFPDRESAPARAVIDMTPEGLKRSRYLADAERLFYRSLAELDRLRALAEKEHRPPSPRFIPPRPAPPSAAPQPEAAAPPPPVTPPPPIIQPAPIPSPSPASRPEVPPAPARPDSRNERVQSLLDSLLDAPNSSKIDLAMVPQRPPITR